MKTAVVSEITWLKILLSTPKVLIELLKWVYNFNIILVILIFQTEKGFQSAVFIILNMNMQDNKKVFTCTSVYTTTGEMFRSASNF